MLFYKTIGFKRGEDAGLREGEFAGYGAAFNNLDRDGEIIDPGAFARTLPEFLKSGVIAWQHDWQTPIGKPLEAREDETGLFLKGRISETAAGRDALTLLRDGVIQKMSIGYRVKGSAELSEEQARERLGDGYDAAMRALPWWRDSIRVLTDIELYEVSLVTVPANPEARVTGVKAAERIESIRAFERFLRDAAGFSKAQATAIAAGGWKALRRDAGAGQDDDTDDSRRDSAELVGQSRRSADEPSKEAADKTATQTLRLRLEHDRRQARLRRLGV